MIFYVSNKALSEIFLSIRNALLLVVYLPSGELLLGKVLDILSLLYDISCVRDDMLDACLSLEILPLLHIELAFEFSILG
ncbi:hypothetical protein HanXRQr2_Chr01g0006471 [Helianthus annuus]|uniref:Uncharacterized protein n=1 Tax=Helianthus annuus TaxID=4232 RepID=A0A9K3JS66_HELAN|nr:hypothetical protein HanXRQr2_Chr01g0006471 [Helianthus annuus]KAJ0621309.1 hypothetical protein HanIR_Chr01g0007221 [Helianthus annuus]